MPKRAGEIRVCVGIGPLVNHSARATYSVQFERKKDWQPYPVDAQFAESDDHTPPTDPP